MFSGLHTDNKFNIKPITGRSNMNRIFIFLLFLILSVQLYSLAPEQNITDTQSSRFVSINQKKSKVFSAPGEKLVSSVFLQDSVQRTRIYGSILIKSKGTKGVAKYWIRIWDGTNYFYHQVNRTDIKSGTTVFSYNTANGLHFTVKCPEDSFTQKTLNVEVTGKVLHPDFLTAN